jgi:hypothetical protein
MRARSSAMMPLFIDYFRYFHLAFRIKHLGSKGLLKDLFPSSRMFLMTKKRNLTSNNLLNPLRKKSKKHSGNLENKEESKGFMVI